MKNIFEAFGYTLTKDEKDDEENLDTFSPPIEKDGAVEISSYSDPIEPSDYVSNTKYIFDFESHFETEEQRINEYRRTSLMVEADYAITDIVNESVVQDQFEDPVDINLDDTEWSESIKTKIADTWSDCTNIFNLNSEISNIFRQWYVDGKIYYHKVVDSKKPNEGIKELRYLDPRRIKKVREVVKKDPRNDLGATETIDKVVEYYIYSLKPVAKGSLMGEASMTNDAAYQYSGSVKDTALQIQPDMIAYSHSGIVGDDATVYSYLQKALKPLNQLNLIEDAIVIYRLSRAPERRIFYVDVGNLNKTRAEQHIKSLINKYRNKFVYNTNTGSIKTNKQNLSMMEDIWLPRQEGSKGTEVSTLEGGQNLGELEDLNYFRSKSYRALNVPVSRLDTETTFNVGRSSEITRDEIRFAKFADKLRTQFSAVFYDVLYTQLVLTKVITPEDWKKEKNNIKFIFNKDSYYDELKEQEILQSRLDILQNINDYADKYYSVEWIRKRVLMQDDEEMKEIDKQIEEEKKKYGDEEEDDDMGGGFEFGDNRPESRNPPEPKPVPVVVQEPEPEKEEKPDSEEEK